MKASVLVSAAAVALMLGTVTASAQSTIQPTTSGQPTSRQSAPAESSHASGHDAQTSKPETGPNAAQTQGQASDEYKDATKKDKK